MKKLFVAILAFSILTTAAFAQRRTITEGKIKFKLEDVSKVDPSGESGTAKWISMDISYVLPKKEVGGQIEWIDDLEMEVDVVIPSSYKGKESFHAMLTGKFTFWSVAQDGKEHKAMAFIPPQIFERYKRSDMKVKQTVFKDFDARVTIYDKNRKPLGRFYYSTSPSAENAATERFNKMEEPGAPILKVPGGVFPKNKTPWIYWSFDSYDLLKVEGMGSAN